MDGIAIYCIITVFWSWAYFNGDKFQYILYSFCSNQDCLSVVSKNTEPDPQTNYQKKKNRETPWVGPYVGSLARKTGRGKREWKKKTETRATSLANKRHKTSEFVPNYCKSPTFFRKLALFVNPAL